VAEQTERPCYTCNGDKGRIETTTGSNGAQIQVWVACTGCNGTGIAR